MFFGQLQYTRTMQKRNRFPESVLGEFVSENRKFVPFPGVKLTRTLSQALRFCPSHAVRTGNRRFISGGSQCGHRNALDFFVRSNIFVCNGDFLGGLLLKKKIVLFVSIALNLV